MLTEILTKIESDRSYAQQLFKEIDKNLLLELDLINFDLKGLTIKDIVKVSFVLGYSIKTEIDKISLERVFNE